MKDNIIVGDFLPDIGAIQAKNADSVIFIAHKVTAEHANTMRVRAGKVGRVKASLNVLAKATPVYEFGKVQRMQSDADKFNKRADLTASGFEVVENFKRRHALQKEVRVGLFDREVFSDVNNLCRNILLFNGINHNEIRRDLAGYKQDVQNKMERLDVLIAKANEAQVQRLKVMRGRLKHSKPHVTYNVNTEVSVDGDGFSVYSITVLKAFTVPVRVMNDLKNYLNFANAESTTNSSEQYIWRPNNVVNENRLFFDAKTVNKIKQKIWKLEQLHRIS